MLASHLRGRINRIVEPLGRAVGRTGISPNDLTVSGVVVLAVGTRFQGSTTRNWSLSTTVSVSAVAA